jgi:cytoskeletal protein RodZ
VLVSAGDTLNPHSRSSRMLLPIGVLTGVLLGILVSLLYFAMSRRPAEENSNTTSSSSSSRQQEFLQPQQPAPLATASSSPEPSAEPSPSPSVETPSPQNSSTQVELSPVSPISTASGTNGKSNPVVITLDSGVTIEADDAWQTGEGIWYRKHGVVSLLDPKNVKAIKKVSPAEPQPSASASPSP